jgi:hypothetical protein
MSSVRNPTNLVLLLRKRDTGKRGCLKSATSLPKPMYKRISRENDRIPDCVLALADSLASRDISACFTAVKHAAIDLADHSGPMEQREGVTPSSPQRDCFLLFGGPHHLVRILQVRFGNLSNQSVCRLTLRLRRCRLSVSPIKRSWDGGVPLVG